MRIPPTVHQSTRVTVQLRYPNWSPLTDRCGIIDLAFVAPVGHETVKPHFQITRFYWETRESVSLAIDKTKRRCDWHVVSRFIRRVEEHTGQPIISYPAWVNSLGVRRCTPWCVTHSRCRIPIRSGIHESRLCARYIKYRRFEMKRRARANTFACGRQRLWIAPLWTIIFFFPFFFNRMCKRTITVN